MIHIDIKKLGRIPDGGGHRKLGRTIGNRHNQKQGRGYAFVHHAVDDHSRLAYSEIIGDERQETAAGFYRRAAAYYTDHGTTIARVLTDNGSCYRWEMFAEAQGSVVHKRTRPYRPQTNGEVELFDRTLENSSLGRICHSAKGVEWAHQRASRTLSGQRFQSAKAGAAASLSESW